MAIDTITSTISNIPLLRKRDTVNPSSQSDKDDFVTKYEATNDHLANNTVSEINTTISQTNTTIGQINTAVDIVVEKEALIRPHYTAIDSVYANEANINNVSTNMAKITNLDTNMPDINNLDSNMSDINLVSSAIQGGTLPTIINDNSVSNGSTWSSSKIDNQINAAVAGVEVVLKPTITTPTTGEVDYIGSIISSAYTVSSTYKGTLDYVEWQLATDTNFTNIVHSKNDNLSLSYTPQNASPTTQYFVRVRYGSDNHLSKWSDAISFTTPAAIIYAPTITSPTTGAIDLGKNVAVTSSTYAVFRHSEPHESSDWQIATDINFTNIVDESLNDTTNKISWTTPNLTVSTTYYVRVKYKSTSYSSAYSPAISFTTKALFTPTAGIQGTKGFSVAPTDQPFALLGLAEMTGTNIKGHDNYGNYIHTNGSIVCWLPKTFYRVGHPDSPRFATYGANALDIVGTDVFANEAEANASGYALPRCFINGGKEQPGGFVDKYMNSKDGTTASKSIFGGVPISLATTAGYTVSNGMTGCTGILADAVVLSKARGERWNATSAFIYAYLALVSVAQAQAATSTADVAWYDPTGVKNYPKGCNNNALSDVDDTTVVYATAGDSGNANKPKTGATANFAKTTHNGSNNGVADLNGGMFEVTIGITNFGSSATATTAIANDTIYVLKHSTDIATLTAGWNGATDVWGDAANLATKYDSVTSPHPLGSSTGAVYWGNGTNAVLQNDLSGVNRDVCGFIPKNSSSTGATGANLFGNDYMYKYNIQNMVPLACGAWSNSTYAGVFGCHFNHYRSGSTAAYGFRASAYFA